MTNYFSPGAAIVLTLLAAAMWGSWLQIIKHRGNFPLSAIAFWVYIFSAVLIWGITLLLAPYLLPQGILAAMREYSGAAGEILFGGATMSLGMLISLSVMNSVGLLLSTAISGAVGSILGLATSLALEGLPKGDNALVLLAACTIVFIAAGFVCNYAAVLRDRDRAGNRAYVSKRGGPVTLRVIFLLLISTLLVNGWSIGTTSGTAKGVPPILTCAYLATGCLISIALYCGVSYTVKREWRAVLCIGQKKKPILLCVIGAVCHFGGNLISIYSMPAISATLSFMFGRTASVWTYFWGFYYREFSGSKRRTVVILTIGLALYFIGLLLLGFFNYG